MKFLKFALAGALALSLGACALLGDSGATSALNAVRTTLTSYSEVYQPALLVYGRLPDCPANGAPCKNPTLWVTLKEVDAKTTKAIVDAQPVLNGSVLDQGQVLDALTAVQDAKSQIIIGTGKVPEGAH